MGDIYSHVDIEFNFIPPVWLDQDEVIIAVPYDHSIHEIDITNKVDIEPHKTYEIKLDKTEIKRLPHPFPSNCSNSKGEDIFPGRLSDNPDFFILEKDYLPLINNVNNVCSCTIKFIS